MIWFTWRQFRIQAMTAALALSVLLLYLVFLGIRIRESFENSTDCGPGCTLAAARNSLEGEYFLTLLVAGFLIIAVPIVIGVFWGAPLIAKELETGTYQLAWNQSITRVRWLAVKLAIVTLVGMALSGALSLTLTWAAEPYDRLAGQRFDPLIFSGRNIVPFGYAVFAIVLGTVVGLIVRRTVPAMAITLAIFVALQVLVPTVIRPNLQPPVEKTVLFDPSAIDGSGRVNLRGDAVLLESYEIPGAWVLSNSTTLLGSDDIPIASEELASCPVGNTDETMACIAALDVHFVVTYQPANRYWKFQSAELSAYLAMSGLLATFAFWKVTRGLS